MFKKKDQSGVKSGIYAMGGHIATLGFSFLSLTIIVRLLSQEDFGIWVLYLTLVSVAEMARMGFVQNGLVKYCADQPQSYRRILSSGFVLNLVIGSLMWAIILILSFPLGKLWSISILFDLVLWYGCYMITFGSLRFMEYVQMANNDFKGVFIGNSIQGALFFGSMLYFWFTSIELSIHYLIPLQCIAAAGGLVFVAAYCAKKGYLRVGSFSSKWFFTLIHYGKYVFGTNISSMLLQRMDVIMIGYFINPVAVAYYNIAIKITNYLEIPLKGIAQVMFPKIAAANKREGIEGVGKLYERSIGLLEALEIPIFLLLFIFAEEIVYLIAGPLYAESVTILRILLLTAIIKPFGRMFGTTLDAIGKPQLNFRLLIYSLCVNGGLNVLMIPYWGTIGAAFATVLSILITTVWGQWVISRIVPFRLKSIFTQMLSFYQQGILWGWNRIGNTQSAVTEN